MTLLPRPPVRVPPRALRLLLGATLALVLLAQARPARAEEVFVLENGSVLRGTLLRETPDGLVIKLSGFFADDARVTVPASRVVQRYASRQGPPPTVPRAPALAATDGVAGDARDLPYVAGSPWTAPHLTLDPLEEPPPQREGFFERMRRVGLMAMPGDRTSQCVLALLLVGAMTALVLLGARLLEVEGATLTRALLQASAATTLLVALVLYRDTLLRADRALWVLPAAAGAWLTLAWGSLRCSFGKAVMLLAFQAFSLSIVVFTAGAVLVAS